ncbi:hypothetical protein SDJN03_15449, partial [Cucurbita argyrosperma subsp. sororia]
MATTTVPPAAMLSKKFFSDGETPGPAASATSGITIDAVRAAAVSPVMAFSFKDDRTATSLPLDVGAAAMALRDLEEEEAGNGLKKAWLDSLLWVALVNGRASETVEVEAIDMIRKLCEFPELGILVSEVGQGSRKAVERRKLGRFWESSKSSSLSDVATSLCLIGG